MGHHQFGQFLAGRIPQQEQERRPVLGDRVDLPIPDNTGRITSYIAVKEDITHLKVIEEELRKSEEKNREILDAIPDIMFKMDRAGNCLDESLAGKIEEVFPDDPQGFPAAYRESL